MKKRPYKLRKRALGQERTRQRIVDAAIELHGTRGPKNTSISAVAKRAGVQRLTVYRYFPDEFALFTSCSSHWLSQNPPPNPEAWSGIATPERRTTAALTALYAYYRVTSPMLTLVYRDADEVEALKGPIQGFQGYLDVVRDSLVAVWRPDGRRSRLFLATVAHSIAFSTWSSLSGMGLSDSQICHLLLKWISTADA